MRKSRTLAALAAATIAGALAWATPAEATPQAGKVTTAITDVACGKATVSIVLADGVSGVYNARVYANGDEIARIPSNGTTPATKTVEFDEDSHGGTVDLWVSVIDGPESDYRPKTIAAKVSTNCKPADGPVVDVTPPTCDTPKQTIKVSNPNVLDVDKLRVRVGLAAPVELGPGESTSVTVDKTVFVWVKSGRKWAVVKKVKWVPPTCPTATATAVPSATATAAPSSSASPRPSLSPAAGVGGGTQSGGLPVTGASVLTVSALGVLLLAGGGIALVTSRRRRTRFTA